MKASQRFRRCKIRCDVYAMSGAGRERKRRKWDVADPHGVPVSGASAPAPATSLPAGSSPATSLAGALPATSAPANRGPPSADAVARAKQGAMSVLEKINQDLQGKGNAPLRVGLKLDEDRIKREITINDAPPQIRFNLTKRYTQDEIARRTGTQVVVRGRYTPPGAPPAGDEPPLFLKVTPGLVASEPDHVQEEAVEKAAAEIRYLLQGGAPGTFRPSPARIHSPAGQQAPYQHGHPHGAASQPMSQPVAYPTGHHHQMPPQTAAPYGAVPPVGQTPAPVPLYVSVEAPPEFGLAGKLRGPGDSFLSHIAQSTGTTVVLRGRGGGMVETPEPLHILVSGSDQKGIDEATKLATNLIDTVRQEAARAFPYGAAAAPYAAPPMQPPGYGAVPPVAAYRPPYPYPAPAPGYANPGQPAPGYQGGYYAQQQAPPPHPAYSAAQYPAQPYYPPPAGQAAPYYAPPPGSVHPPSAAPQGGPPGSQQQHQSPAAQGQPPAEQPGPPGAPPGTEEAQAQERKRRFKEVKDTPPPVPEKPAPYAPKPMGPPPPRKPSAGPMGPPPPRPSSADAQGGAGNSKSESSISGSLEGLVDY